MRRASGFGLAGVVAAVGLAGLAGLSVACASAPVREPGSAAAAYAAAGRHAEAAREVELAIRSHPRDPELRRLAGDILGKAGDLDSAVGHLEVGTRLAPANSEIWIMLGEIELERDNIADAYVAFRRAAELAPDDIRGVSGLARTADALGLSAEANEAYARWAALEKEMVPQAAPPPASRN